MSGLRQGQALEGQRIHGDDEARSRHRQGGDLRTQDQADARLDRVRAFVKIQDGCSFACSFCVIPLVRGASRSRSADAVLREVRRRLEQGHRQIVLTGINLDELLDPHAYVGRAPEQVKVFLEQIVSSVRKGYETRYSILSTSEPKV